MLTTLVHPLLRTAPGVLLFAVLAGGMSACGGDSANEAQSGRAATPVAHPITIDYPLEGSIFPPEVIPPLFLWHDDAAAANAWRVSVTFEDNTAPLLVETDGPPAPRGRIDPDALGPTNSLYEPTPYQATAHSWRPSRGVGGDQAALRRGTGPRHRGGLRGCVTR